VRENLVLGKTCFTDEIFVKSFWARVRRESSRGGQYEGKEGLLTGKKNVAADSYNG